MRRTDDRARLFFLPCRRAGQKNTGCGAEGKDRQTVLYFAARASEAIYC